MSFQSLPLRSFPRNDERESAEARFWKKFKTTQAVEQVSSVTHIAFCPSAPYDFCVTASTRVIIYSGRTGDKVRQLTRFPDTALGGTFRSDGKVAVAGCMDGRVRAFEAKSRVVLRQFEGHEDAVHAAQFTADKLRVVSASDDRTLRLWELQSGKELRRLTGHDDYVRCLTPVKDNENLWISGSYDGTVRLWDLRADEAVRVMKHEHPVTSVLCVGNLLASAGDRHVRVWDVLSGGGLMHSFSSHQKTVTSLALDSSGSRLLTGSLDHHVKFHELGSYQVTHSFKYPSPVLALAVSPADNMMAVGMANGLLSIRKREAPSAGPQRRRAPKAGSYGYFVRGQNQKPSEDDFQVDVEKKRRLRPYDRFLKRFQYRDALDEALKTRHAIIITSMVEELIQRGGLRIAVTGRSSQSLLPLLKFLTKYIANPHYTQLLIDLALVVFEEYAAQLGRSAEVDQCFLQLQRKISEELEMQKNLLRLKGTLDMFIGAPRVTGVIQAAADAADAEDGEQRQGVKRSAEDENGEADASDSEGDGEDDKDDSDDDMDGGASSAAAAARSSKPRKRRRRKKSSTT